MILKTLIVGTLMATRMDSISKIDNVCPNPEYYNKEYILKDNVVYDFKIIYGSEYIHSVEKYSMEGFVKKLEPQPLKIGIIMKEYNNDKTNNNS